MMRSPLLPFLAALALAQDERPRHVSPTRAFSLVLPEGWRQLTPDEARLLRKRGADGYPGGLLDPRPADVSPYGNVDRWLQAGFDGEYLAVEVSDHEIDLEDDEAVRLSIEELRRFVHRAAATGVRIRIERAERVELGPDRHPALEVLAWRQHGAGTLPVRSLEYYVPTGGRTVILAFCAVEERFPAAVARFRGIARTATFARPPRGSGRLGENLLYTAVIGALVGLAIAVLRKRAVR